MLPAPPEPGAVRIKFIYAQAQPQNSWHRNRIRHYVVTACQVVDTTSALSNSLRLKSLESRPLNLPLTVQGALSTAPPRLHCYPTMSLHFRLALAAMCWHLTLMISM